MYLSLCLLQCQLLSLCIILQKTLILTPLTKCGRPPPRWPSMIFTSWYLHPLAMYQDKKHGLSLPRLGYKRLWLSSLGSPSLLSLILGRQLPYWEHLSHVERPTWQEMRLPANSHVSEPLWKWTLQPQVRLQLIQPQPTVWFKQLCAIPWVRRPTEPKQDSWSSETVR